MKIAYLNERPRDEKSESTVLAIEAVVVRIKCKVVEVKEPENNKGKNMVKKLVDIWISEVWFSSLDSVQQSKGLNGICVTLHTPTNQTVKGDINSSNSISQNLIHPVGKVQREIGGSSFVNL